MVRLLALVVIVFLLIYGLFWIFGKTFDKVPSKLIAMLLLMGFVLGLISSVIFYYVWFL